MAKSRNIDNVLKPQTTAHFKFGKVDAALRNVVFRSMPLLNLLSKYFKQVQELCTHCGRICAVSDAPVMYDVSQEYSAEKLRTNWGAEPLLIAGPQLCLTGCCRHTVCHVSVYYGGRGSLNTHTHACTHTSGSQ